jgi:hypothetical protein
VTEMPMEVVHLPLSMLRHTAIPEVHPTAPTQEEIGVYARAVRAAGKVGDPLLVRPADGEGAFEILGGRIGWPRWGISGTTRRPSEQAWLATFGEPTPAALLWSSHCRMSATPAADAIGIKAAAQHTGRSEEVARRIDERRRMRGQAEAAATLDRLRKRRSR